MKSYKALLFAPDGHWVTDCRAETIKGVIEKLNDLGSKWIFYPLCHFIIRDYGQVTSPYQRIVDACEPFEFLKGKAITTTQKVIQNNPKIVADILNL